MDGMGVDIFPAVSSHMKDVCDLFVHETGYDVLAMQLHAGEGNLHFHISYSEVSLENELLHPKRNVGKKGLRLAGPAAIGSMRQGEFLPEDDAHIVGFKKLLKTRRKDQRRCIDHEIAFFLDHVSCEERQVGFGVQEQATYQALLAIEKDDYGKAVVAVREKQGDALELRLEEVESGILRARAERQQAEYERDQARRERNRLRTEQSVIIQELRQAKAANQRLIDLQLLQNREIASRLEKSRSPQGSKPQSKKRAQNQAQPPRDTQPSPFSDMDR
ncbi:MAG: hypothetical protein V2I43_27055 [Parvularcula sp.]|nr:hypothetical protein [Parvularcula sp.]